MLIGTQNYISPSEVSRRFKNREPLEEGGMSVVEAADDTLLDCRVALKISKPKFHDFFEDEYRALADICSPRVPSLIGIGKTPEGDDIIEMELIEGSNLAYDSRLWEGTTPERLLFISSGTLEHICLAVQAIHDAGILHLDLKPSNVLISKDNAVVIDVGLSLRRNDPNLYCRNAIRGTPEYISPEMAQFFGHVYPSTDVFALGGIIQELITKKLPINGESAPEMIENALKGAYPRLSVGNPPHDLNPKQADGWPAVAEVVNRAREKNPKNRQQNCMQFFYELNSALIDMLYEEPPATRESSNLLKRHPSTSSKPAFLPSL